MPALCEVSGLLLPPAMNASYSVGLLQEPSQLMGDALTAGERPFLL